MLSFGESLVGSGHYASDEVQQSMSLLQTERTKISEAWLERKNEHTQVSEHNLCMSLHGEALVMKAYRQTKHEVWGGG